MEFEHAFFELDVDDAERAALAELLDEGERARAAGFHFPEGRARFVAAHGHLRRWLGRLTGVEPAALRIAELADGKPWLPDFPGLCFNLSHSAWRGLAVASRVAELGCDIEQVVPRNASMKVARRFFADDEFAVLEGLPEAQRVEGFFNCWTRKEAFIKAIGRGLAYPLESFAVTLVPGEAPRLLRGEPPCDIVTLDAGDGFCAAVVVLRGRGPQKR